MTNGAAIVIVGDEILSAKTVDRNTLFLTRELRELGVRVKRVLVVSDDVDEIAWAVTECRRVASYVFTTGGIGPTHDDLTIHGVAKALGRPVSRLPRLEQLIRDYLTSKGNPDEMESALKMAEMPEGTEFLDDGDRSFPVTFVENVYMFPGIPSVLEKKWAAVRESFRQNPYCSAEIYLTPHEHLIARNLAAIQREHPTVALGSYPDIESAEFNVKVTLESKESGDLERVLEALLALLDPEHVVRVVRPTTSISPTP